MAIRIECELGGFEKNWIEFRDAPWPFGDRRKMMEGQTDLVSLGVILDYTTNWRMQNAKDTTTVPFNEETGIEILDNLDEILVNWIIGAWFEARTAREQVSKKASES